MRRTITDTQAAFFTKNGYIEFEIPHSMPPHSSIRDQWRSDPTLQNFILKELGPLSLVLTGKKQLRLGLSEWITSENRPSKPSPLKEIVSLQNLAVAISLSPHPVILKEKSALGILPLPSSSSNALFFQPHLILDWPHTQSDVFLILLTLPNGVYIHNPKDPQTTYLKALGYGYGDLLKSETHPIIM